VGKIVKIKLSEGVRSC